MSSTGSARPGVAAQNSIKAKMIRRKRFISDRSGGRWDRPPDRPRVLLRRHGLAAALAGLHVEVPAGERLAPIGDQVLRSFEVVGPLVTRHQARGLPDGVKLPVRLDLADIDRLGDV